jgi:hypothetical protein
MCHSRNLTLKHYGKPNVHWKVNQIGRFWHFGVNVMEWSHSLPCPLCHYAGCIVARLTLRGLSLGTLRNVKPRLMGQAMHLTSFFFFLGKFLKQQALLPNMVSFTIFLMLAVLVRMLACRPYELYKKLRHEGITPTYLGPPRPFGSWV